VKVFYTYSLSIALLQTHIYVISSAIKIVNQRLYKKWNYQAWCAALRELHYKDEEQLNVTYDGVLAFDKVPLGRIY
jgi:hypothetical protein